MNTESTNTGVVLKGSVDLTERDLLRLGAEYQRYRLDDWWPASGGGMWPNTFWNVNDGKRDRTAVYAEWEGRPDPRWTTLAGVRYERVETDTGPVQAYNNGLNTKLIARIVQGGESIDQAMGWVERELTTIRRGG
mgnify:CR=1 FL=1